jgi:hypothetical protein
MATLQHAWTLSDGTTGTVTATIAPAAETALTAWMQATLPQQNDASGNPIARTEANLLRQLFEGTFVDLMNQVSSWAAQQAAAQAAAAVAPVSPAFS